MNQPSFLLLIPACNEEKRLEPTLRLYAGYARAHYQGDFQLLVVVNGSTDQTLAIAERLAGEFPSIRSVNIPGRIGKGGALIQGLKLALHADLIGYADADGATSAESLFRLAEVCARPGVDAVIGSRRIKGAVIHQMQPNHRVLASKTFHRIVETLFLMRIHDTQCGAKVMRQAAVRKVLDFLHIADMAFDVNLIYALRRAGCHLLEFPVDWTDHLGSTVSYFRTSMVMFMSVVRLRLLHSPFRALLWLTRPLETRIYRALRNPAPSPPNKPPAGLK